jgi:hypothetical protein
MGWISTTTTLFHPHVPLLSSVHHRACQSTGAENRDSRNGTFTKLGARLDTQSTRSTGWRCTTWGGSRAATTTKLRTRCRHGHTTPDPKSAASYVTWITIKSTVACWTRTHVQPHCAPQRHATTTQTGSDWFPWKISTTHDTDTSHSGRSSYWAHRRRRQSGCRGLLVPVQNGFATRAAPKSWTATTDTDSICGGTIALHFVCGWRAWMPIKIDHVRGHQVQETVSTLVVARRKHAGCQRLVDAADCLVWGLRRSIEWRRWHVRAWSADASSHGDVALELMGKAASMSCGRRSGSVRDWTNSERRT